MFFVSLLVLIAAISCVCYFIFILCKSYPSYKEYVQALEKRDCPFRLLIPFGLAMLDTYNYSFCTKYDRRLLNLVSEIYGQEYSAFYIRVIYANKILLIAAFIVGEQLIALITQFSVAGMFYVLLLSFLAFISSDTKLKNRVKARRIEIQLRFPDFINKLTLLLNAGMTISKAWEKISVDSAADAEGSSNAFYKEVHRTAVDLKGGKNEAEAFSGFAKRVKTPEISRLMSTILQNTKRGGNDLVLTLRLQANECWEMRKNAVRRLGEEASTKLLFPMMIMFFAIIIIVVTPAILSMRGMTSNL